MTTPKKTTRQAAKDVKTSSLAQVPGPTGTYNIAPALYPFAVPLATLTLDPRNARTHDEKNLATIKTSYSRFGQQRPILIDATGTILAGNGQATAARELGWTHIAAITTALTGKEATAFSLVDNKSAEQAGWDNARLAELLSELMAEDQALVDAAGFGEVDINQILATPTPAPNIDHIPEQPDPAVTQPGDLWILGDHRLLCGNSADPAALDYLLDGATIHLVNTDPPYNVQVEPRSNNAMAIAVAAGRPRVHQGFDLARKPSNEPTTAKMRAKDRPLANDAVTDDAFAQLLTAWFGNLARVLAPGRSYYIWGGYANLWNYPHALTQAGLHFAQMIIWVKNSPVMTRKDYMGNHEWSFYGWKEGAAHFFAPGIHNAQDTWEVSAATDPQAEAQPSPLADGLILQTEAGPIFLTPDIPKKKYRHVNLSPGKAAHFYRDGPTDLWRVRKLAHTATVHLTEKPVELALRAMHYSSRKGENVLDLFGGSGSTMMAAHQLGRHAYTMELDPLYCDVMVRRWEEFTDRKATRVPAPTATPIPEAEPLDAAQTE